MEWSEQHVRLVVVDEQLTFAEALAARLDVEPDIEVVGAVPGVEAMVAVLERSAVDIVLLALPGDDPERTTGDLEVVRGLTTGAPAVRVVVLAARTEPTLVAAAIEAGISGWVPKESGLASLLETVRGVRQDETWIPAHVLTGVLSVLVAGGRQATDQATVLSRLTPREHDVLECIVDGLSRQEIAQRLFLSPNTVRTHVQHVLRKLGVHSTLTAAAVARDLGIGPSRSASVQRLHVPSQDARPPWLGRLPAS